MRRDRRARPSDMVEKPRKSTYNLGPRLSPRDDRKAFRTVVVVALVNARGPVTARQLWHLMGGADGPTLELHTTLGVMAAQGLVEVHGRIDGIHYRLTAKGEPLCSD